MNKWNILLLVLLMVPVCTFLLFSQEAPTQSTIVYLHEQANIHRSSQEHLNQFIGKGNVVVDFYADWCGPCRRLSSLIDAAVGILQNVTFLKINRDFFKDLAQLHRVTSIPTLIFFRNGQEIGRYDGKPLTQDELIRLIKNTYSI